MQVLTDAQWTKFEAAITAVKLRGACPHKEKRRTIETIIWRLDNVISGRGSGLTISTFRSRLASFS